MNITANTTTTTTTTTPKEKSRCRSQQCYHCDGSHHMNATTLVATNALGFIEHAGLDGTPHLIDVRHNTGFRRDGVTVGGVVVRSDRPGTVRELRWS